MPIATFASASPLRRSKCICICIFGSSNPLWSMKLPLTMAKTPSYFYIKFKTVVVAGWLLAGWLPSWLAYLNLFLIMATIIVIIFEWVAITLHCYTSTVSSLSSTHYIHLNVNCKYNCLSGNFSTFSAVILGENFCHFLHFSNNNLIMSSSAAACNCVTHELAGRLWHHWLRGIYLHCDMFLLTTLTKP